MHRALLLLAALPQLPPATYPLHESLRLRDGGDCNKLSRLQLEGVLYACQRCALLTAIKRALTLGGVHLRHQQILSDGTRAGFFIGDGRA